MKYIFFVCFLLLHYNINAQLADKLSSAMQTFNADAQLKYATAALSVIDATSGKAIFNENAQTGMAPASTQKIITAATAFALLGKDFTYETKFGIITTATGKSLYIQPSADPTLGSWRWEETKENLILSRIKNALRQKNITQLESVIINYKNWQEDNVIPDGWIWQDLGQYYGAAAHGLNWRENQFDVIVKSGDKIGSPVTIVTTKPFLYDYTITSMATAAAKGTGDHSYLYYPSLGETVGVLRGTIPAGENNFTISGSMANPAMQFAKTIINEIKDVATVKDGSVHIVNTPFNGAEWLYTHTSPPLSKIIYWFLRKSVNLYGEALLKTIALQKTGEASTHKGIETIQKFWADNGIHKEELHLHDGSGLSPQNRVTPHAHTVVLQYARQQNWTKDFYDALPLYNDMKMKSGTINRVKGFTGYHTSKAGKEYIFSILVNNYNGSELSLIRKMYKVLDVLK